MMLELVLLDVAKSLPPLHTRLGELRADLEEEKQALAEAGARWLEAKAGSRDTSKIEAEINEHERATSRLERKIHKAERKRT